MITPPPKEIKYTFYTDTFFQTSSTSTIIKKYLPQEYFWKIYFLIGKIKRFIYQVPSERFRGLVSGDGAHLLELKEKVMKHCVLEMSRLDWNNPQIHNPGKREWGRRTSTVTKEHGEETPFFSKWKMLLSQEGSSGSRKELVTVHFEASLEREKKEEITNVIKHKKVGVLQVDFKIESQFFPEVSG